MAQHVQRSTYCKKGNKLIYFSFSLLLSLLFISTGIFGQVNGRNVTKVNYNGGSFTNTSPGKWSEVNRDGSHNFNETNRDEWSVYMIDPSRDISIQLDLWKKEIYIYWERPNRSLLYKVNDFSAGSSNNSNSDGPQGYTRCAGENQSYTFSGTVDVAYGANGHFSYRQGVSGTINFNNGTFGDPIPGTLKSGYYKASGGSGGGTITDIVNTLSPADEKKILTWMLGEASDAQIGYCYKRSHPRHTEGLTTCANGYEKNGELCYPLCRDGYYGNGPMCQIRCPEGFKDDQVSTCWKPVDYGRGAGYPWEFGDTPFSLDDARRRCQNANPQGCEKYGEIIYPICNPGYTNSGCCLCTVNCPPGMSNSGAGCLKGNNYGRGAGEPMKCRDGLIHNGAGLCFERCPDGYSASSDADPVCWMGCPDNQPYSCGAGCAKDMSTCVQETWGMVQAVGEMCLNIVSLGETAAFNEAKGAVKTAVMAGDKAAAKAAAKLAAKELAKGFEQMTTKKVLKKLKEEFTENALEWLKEEYCSLMLKNAKNEEFSTDDLWDLAGLDPTGAAEVVHAFFKPICAQNNPFPTLDGH